LTMTASASDTATSSPRTLLTIETTKENPRNSEGDIIQLRDGRLCLVYTRFREGGADHSPADLAMRVSSDGGNTWSGDRILLPNEGGANVMSVTLRRIRTGELLLFYLRKDTEGTSCNLYVRRSTDELDTLSSPTRVTLLDGYHVVNNDRVVELSSGRLIVPAALHTEPGDAKPFNSKAVCFAYYSDDGGRTWSKDATPITPVDKREKIFQEPGIVELADGRLMMYIRTGHGSQYAAYSTDQGNHWTKAEPTALASPTSPACIKRIPGSADLLCVWNDHTGAHPFPKAEARTPLAAAVSHDDGKTWSKSRIIEHSDDHDFAYTSIAFVGDRVLLSYWVNDRKAGRIALRVTEAGLGWLTRSE
jgi:sialidase-1